MATPTYNTSDKTSDGASAATTITLASFAAGAGSNRFLEVWACSGDTTTTSPTGVTWGGVALTQRNSVQVSGFASLTKWYMKEASRTFTSAADIVVTWPDARDERAIMAMVHNDVDQTNPYRNASQTAESDANTTAPSVTISSNADDVATVGIWSAHGSPNITGISFSLGTERQDTGPVPTGASGYECGAIATIAGGASVTFTAAIGMTGGTTEYNTWAGDSLQGAAAAASASIYVVPNAQRIIRHSGRY